MARPSVDPGEVFNLEEQPRLLPAPAAPYDLPVYVTAKVHRDHHIEVAKALYSVPGNLIGSRVEVRADRSLVRIFSRGQLVKVHPRQAPGHRVSDPDDLPSHTTVYAMRDLDRLGRMAAGHGEAIGVYATALLDIPLPWTKMRQVYALLGLVNKWGPERVEAACRRALEAEAVNVGLIGRMLERGTEQATPWIIVPGPMITPLSRMRSLSGRRCRTVFSRICTSLPMRTGPWESPMILTPAPMIERSPTTTSPVISAVADRMADAAMVGTMSRYVYS